MKAKKKYMKGGKLYKAGGLTPKQKQLDKNKDGKISGQDFKMMKEGGKVPKPKAIAKYRKVQGKGEAAAEAGNIKKAKRKFARSAKLYDKAYGK